MLIMGDIEGLHQSILRRGDSIYSQVRNVESSLDDQIKRDLQKLEKFAEIPFDCDDSSNYSPPYFRGKIDLNAKPKKSILKKVSPSNLISPENHLSQNSLDRRNCLDSNGTKALGRSRYEEDMDQLFLNNQSRGFHNIDLSKQLEPSNMPSCTPTVTDKYSPNEFHTLDSNFKIISRFNNLSPVYDEDYKPPSIKNCISPLSTNIGLNFDDRNIENQDYQMCMKAYEAPKKQYIELECVDYPGHESLSPVISDKLREIIYQKDRLSSQDISINSYDQEKLYDSNSEARRKKHRSSRDYYKHSRSPHEDYYYGSKDYQASYEDNLSVTEIKLKKQKYHSYRNSRSPEYFDKVEYSKRKKMNDYDMYTSKKGDSPCRTRIERLETSFSPHIYRDRSISPYQRRKRRSTTPLTKKYEVLPRRYREDSGSVDPSPPRSRPHSPWENGSSSSRIVSHYQNVLDPFPNKRPHTIENLDVKVDEFLRKNKMYYDYEAHSFQQTVASQVNPISSNTDNIEWPTDYGNTININHHYNMFQSVTEPLNFGTYNNNSIENTPKVQSSTCKPDQFSTVVNGIETDSEKRKKLERNRKKWAQKQLFLTGELQKLKAKAEAVNKHDKSRGMLPVDIENGKLQQEITRQLEKVTSCVTKIDQLLGDPITRSEPDNNGLNQPSSKLYDLQIGSPQIVIKYFDPQTHWCPICDLYFGGLASYLKHLHSSTHTLQYKKIAGSDKPWRNFIENSQEKENMKKHHQIPCGGSEKIVPVNCYYCEICNKWLGDCVMVSEHITSIDHNQSYKKYVEEIPGYESRLVRQKDRVFRQFMKLKQEKENEKTKKVKAQKKKKEEENKKHWEEFVKSQELKNGQTQELEEVADLKNNSINLNPAANDIKKTIKLNLKTKSPIVLDKEDQRLWENLRAKVMKNQLVSTNEPAEKNIKPEVEVKELALVKSNEELTTKISFTIANAGETGIGDCKKKLSIGRMPKLRLQEKTRNDISMDHPPIKPVVTESMLVMKKEKDAEKSEKGESDKSLDVDKPKETKQGNLEDVSIKYISIGEELITDNSDNKGTIIDHVDVNVIMKQESITTVMDSAISNAKVRIKEEKKSVLNIATNPNMES